MSIVKHISWSFLGQLAGAGFGFLNFVLLNRNMSKGEFGTWVLIFSSISLLEMIRTGFSQSAVLKLLGSGLKEPSAIWGSLFSFLLSVNGLVSAVIVLLGIVAFPFFGLTLSLIFPILLVWWAQGFSYVDQWYVQDKNNFKHLTFLKVALLIPFTVYLLIANSFEVEYVLWAYGFSHLGGWLLFRLAFKGVSFTFFKHSSKQVKRYFKLFGRFSFGTQLGANLLRNSDNFLIGAFLGNRWVAAYAIGFKVIELAEVPVRAVSLVLQRKWSHLNNSSEIYRSYLKHAAICTALGVVPAVCLYFFREEAILLLGGEKYLGESLPVLLCILPILLILPSDRLSGVALDMIGKPKANMIKVFVMLLVNLLGDIVVLQMGWGIMAVAGVSIATFGSGFVYGWLRLKYFCK